MLFCFQFQTITSDILENKPIIFGDFLKMGAEPADRMYEDLTDINKLKNVLNDVCCIA